MNTTIQQSYFYKEVRKTQPGPGVVYSGYPIYHLYKNISNNQETRLNEIEYWSPLSNLTEYRQYLPGDENVPAERIKYEPRAEIGIKPVKRYYKDRFNTYTHKYVGTRLYVATNRTQLYPLSPETNPYSYRNIQVWIESPETYENTYDEYGTLIVPSFWYHPFENRFYPFGNLETFGISDSQYLIDSIFTRDTSGESDESLMANAADSIRLAQIDELMSRGASRDEAVALVNTLSQKALDTRAAKSLTVPQAVTSRRPSTPKNISVNVGASALRASSSTASGSPASTSSQSAPISIANTQSPKLVQTTTSGQLPLTYEFLHRPNQISYTNIGSEWSPIDRAANRPMLDWRAYKLMNVSFSFIVAPDGVGSLDQVIDGKVISTTVDDDLKTLRQMASSPFPVVFMGFDKLVEEPVRYPFNNDAGKGSLFVIADFNVTSVYRSSTGAISRASCEMTLTEYPKELIKTIEFPKLRPIPEIPPPPPGSKPVCGNTEAAATFYSRLPLNILRTMAKRGWITQNGKCRTIVILNHKAYDAVQASPQNIDRIDDFGNTGLGVTGRNL